MTLLHERDARRFQRRLELHAEVRCQLRAALEQLIPGARVIVFGSLTKPGRFNDKSDVDIALERETPGMNSLRLTGELMERLGRPVDVVVLAKCRFQEKILREGEVWTL